jgi:hypothetical protein
MDTLSQYNLAPKESQWIEAKTLPLYVEHATLFPSDFFHESSVELREGKIGKMVELVRALGLDLCEALEQVSKCLGYDGMPAFALEVVQLEYQGRCRNIIFIGEVHGSTPSGAELEHLKPLWEHLPVRLLEGYEPKKLVLGAQYAAIIEQRKAEFREQYGLHSSSAITHSLLDAENRISDRVAQGERVTKALDHITQQLEAYYKKLQSGELSKENPCVVVVGPDSLPWLTPDDQKIIEDLILYVVGSQKDPSRKSSDERSPVRVATRVGSLERAHMPSILEQLNSINVVVGEYFSSGITSTASVIGLLATLTSSAACFGTGWLIDSAWFMRVAGYLSAYPLAMTALIIGRHACWHAGIFQRVIQPIDKYLDNAWLQARDDTMAKAILKEVATSEDRCPVVVQFGNAHLPGVLKALQRSARLTFFTEAL